MKKFKQNTYYNKDTLFNESCILYYESIYKYFLTTLQHEKDAEDCTQETFCRYYKRLWDDTEIRNHKAYIYKLARTVNYEQMKQLEKYNKNIAEHLTTKDIPDPIPMDILLESESIEPYIDKIVKLIIDSLTMKEKALYNDYYITKLTTKQIAYNEGRTPYAIRKRLSKLKSTISHLVKKIVYEESEVWKK